ncbi:MAG TPA: YihY/virulence factor BrkB family protein [Candidatus Acidoferrum sp.]|nr:YihY/virulence factor BrkB family protein [Candidatus Acidoferrum sp.]
MPLHDFQNGPFRLPLSHVPSGLSSLQHDFSGHCLQGWWGFFFPAAAIVLAMLSVTVVYRVARPLEKSLRRVLPGAMVATALWWLVNILFGFYVRRVPYSVVYGGLAAVIGLLVWMQLSTVIVFLGAAWNAELAARRGELRARV